MTPAERGSAISSFASQPDCLVLLVSLNAGNSGLNLTCASNVIIMEPSWNPYIEEQAIGRVHRIGQERHVRVYRLLVADTIEIRILELQEKKRKMIRGFSNGAVMLGTDNLIRGDIAYIVVSENLKARKGSSANCRAAIVGPGWWAGSCLKMSADRVVKLGSSRYWFRSR
jgi:superfamily II DNA or RNA helicase